MSPEGINDAIGNRTRLSASDGTFIQHYRRDDFRRGSR
jgi:hypothetical protein